MRGIAHCLIALALLTAGTAPARAFVDGEGRIDVGVVLLRIALYRDHGFLKNAAAPGRLPISASCR